MLAYLDALYEAARRDDPASWLFDRDAARDYADCERFFERQVDELCRKLGAADRDLLERCLANLEERGDHERRIFFRRGLAAGLALGALREAP